MLPFFLNSNALLFLQLEFCAMWLIITLLLCFFSNQTLYTWEVGHMQSWNSKCGQYWHIMVHICIILTLKSFVHAYLPELRENLNVWSYECMHVLNKNLCDKEIPRTIRVGHSAWLCWMMSYPDTAASYWVIQNIHVAVLGRNWTVFHHVFQPHYCIWSAVSTKLLLRVGLIHVA